MKNSTRAFLCMLPFVLAAGPASAGSTGHYVGGLINIRDYILPEPGVYTLVYNYYYQTGRINDRNGNEKKSVNINPGPGPGVNVSVNPDVDLYALVPLIAWVTPYKFLGASVGMYVAPSFANTSVSVALDTERGRGINPDTSQFNIGDWFFQPLWLGWDFDHWFLGAGYGFYAPTGKYDTETFNVPTVGPVKITDPDNTGLGFWTNQFQGTVAWYPFINKATAVTVTGTYEINSNKQHFDFRPGDNLSLNWGISQYLPLTKDHKWLAEVGPTGYDTWQVTHDSGSRANGSLADVNAVGGQLGLTSVDWLASLTFHYYYEFASEDRFQGHVFCLTLSKKL